MIRDEGAVEHPGMFLFLQRIFIFMPIAILVSHLLVQQDRLSLSNVKRLNSAVDTNHGDLGAHHLGALGVCSHPKNGKGNFEMRRGH